MQLLPLFTGFIRREHLFQPKDMLLLAVSGGVDSAVLCALCHQAGYRFAIAHCNFQLRGAESERDEQFVRTLAAKYAAPLYVKRFDTEAYAAQHKHSIQVAARELRYAWFHELLGEPSIAGDASAHSAWIVTAHHADDNIETLLMNFFKGTGIAGLRGMLPRQGKIVRPLLFAGKEDLRSFAAANGLQWVEDSSNDTDDYTRNYIRHKMLPAIRGAYPQVDANLSAHLRRFRGVEQLYRQAVENIHKKLVEQKGNELHIPILKLLHTRAPDTVLFELLYPLGFTPAQAEEALHLVESGTGRYVASATHRILRNRNWLIIAPLAAEETAHILIESSTKSVQFGGGQLTVCIETLPAANNASGGASAAMVERLDASGIKFPLLLRRWRPGDYFYPLGMRKKKKLARFFIDRKLSATDKEKVWVLESDKKILYVIGLRIDDRFKITAGTKQVMTISYST